MKNHYQVAIVGAGIRGTTLASEAAICGLDVVLLDAGDIASGPSSATAGLFSGKLRQLEKSRL